ncbi:MAG: hypothetical protein IKS16_01695 [Lachnospiraceae bacterium]|nr:hypothetical protein [Lachnospiraceae bacterium]
MPNQYVNKVVQSNGTSIMDITDTTAVASDVAQGKYFYLATGQKVAGTATGGSGLVWQDENGFVHLSDQGGGSSGLYDYFGAGTQYLGKLYTHTYNLSSDTSYDSWAPSTTSTIIRTAPSEYEYEYTCSDIENYTYWFVETAHTSIAYKSGVTLVSIPVNSVSFKIQKVNKQPVLYSDWSSGNWTGTSSSSTMTLSTYMYYHSTDGNLGVTSAGYGPMWGTPASATFSSFNSKIKFKMGNISARCSDTIFSTSQNAYIDSANTNLVYEIYLYKTPWENTYLTYSYDMVADLLNSDM